MSYARKNKKASKKDNEFPFIIREEDKKNFLKVFVCGFIALVLVFGLVLGIIMMVNDANSVVSFEGVTMDEEVASFFVTLNKTYYIAMLNASQVEDVSDNHFFWNRDAGAGKTYGQLLKEDTKSFISLIMVTNYIFDSGRNLTGEDEHIISNAVNGVLDFAAGGNVDKFNEKAKKCGFSYDSFEDAVTMLYKYAIVMNMNGVNLSEANKKEHIADYTHVKLLFIRTDSTFEVDDDGNRVVGNDGYVMHEYTEAEKAAVSADIAEIREAIAISGSGVDGGMSELMFNTFLKKYKNDGSSSMINSGYYFSEDEKFTSVFRQQYSDIVDTALEMSVGEYAEAEFAYGTCFIYKYKSDVSDLNVSALSGCFDNFYSTLMLRYFDKTLSEIGKDVEFKSEYDDIKIFDLWCNSELVPSF